MEVKIATDHKWKQFKHGYELPKKVRKEFDYMSEEDYISNCEFFEYHKTWYNTWDFQVVTKVMKESNPIWNNWDGYSSDSFFSGIVIKFNKEDNDFYQVGLYLS